MENDQLKISITFDDADNGVRMKQSELQNFKNSNTLFQAEKLFCLMIKAVIMETCSATCLIRI